MLKRRKRVKCPECGRKVVQRFDGNLAAHGVPGEGWKRRCKGAKPISKNLKSYQQTIRIRYRKSQKEAHRRWVEKNREWATNYMRKWRAGKVGKKHRKKRG